MTDLTKHIHARNVLFSNKTQNILTLCSDTLDSFFKYMVEGKMSATWFSVDFHQANEKLVNLVAMGRHNVGETITTEGGEDIYIDKENVDNYVRVMRFMVPLKFVETGDVDAMLLFMEEFAEIVTKIPETEIEALVADDNFLKEVFSAFSESEPTEDKVNKAVKYDGFDLSGLSLEQIQQLKLCKEGKT
jgi:hypothetical protein